MPFRATGFRSEAEPAPKQTAALNVLAISGDPRLTPAGGGAVMLGLNPLNLGLLLLYLTINTYGHSPELNEATVAQPVEQLIRNQ